MPINVSEAIDSDTAERITVTRSALAGSRVDGRWVPPATTSFKTLASVQQPTPKQLDQMPSGDRDTEYKLFISIKELLSSDDSTGQVADTLSYKGKKFKVVQPMDWTAYGHSTVIAARVKKAE